MSSGESRRTPYSIEVRHPVSLYFDLSRPSPGYFFSCHLSPVLIFIRFFLTCLSPIFFSSVLYLGDCVTFYDASTCSSKNEQWHQTHLADGSVARFGRRNSDAKKHKCSRKGISDWIVFIRVGGVLPLGNSWATGPKTNDG